MVLSLLPVASDLAVDDALGLVIDHSGLSLNNNSVSGIRPNHKRLRKGCIGQSRLALDDNRLRAKCRDSKLDQYITKFHGKYGKQFRLVGPNSTIQSNQHATNPRFNIYISR